MHERSKRGARDSSSSIVFLRYLPIWSNIKRAERYPISVQSSLSKLTGREGNEVAGVYCGFLSHGLHFK